MRAVSRYGRANGGAFVSAALCVVLLTTHARAQTADGFPKPLVVYRTVVSGARGLSADMLVVCPSGAVIHRRMAGPMASLNRLFCAGPAVLTNDEVSQLERTILEAGFEKFLPRYRGRHWPYTELSITATLNGQPKRVELVSSEKEPPAPEGWSRIVKELGAIKQRVIKGNTAGNRTDGIAGTLIVSGGEAAVAVDDARLRLVSDPPQTALALETMLARTADQLRFLNGRRVRVRGHRQGDILWSAVVVDPGEKKGPRR
jgi:hypothetical protein